jgi:cytohesin
VSEDLLFAAQLGLAGHIAQLIQSGVDPNWRRPDGTTTLMIAALFGRVSIIEALLDHGADIDLRAPDGTTALLAATIYAATTRDTSTIEALVSRGANPNLANSEGNTALGMTARNGLIEGAVLLLKAGADPNAANQHGLTPLMQAARGHLVETVRVLLRAGADPARRSSRGLTAAQIAAEIGPPPAELVELLKPRELGAIAVGKRNVAKFDHPDFKVNLVGSWNEQSRDERSLVLVDVTGERQIAIHAEPAADEPDIGARRDPVTEAALAKQGGYLEQSGGRCRLSPVRAAEAGDVVQVRFNGVDESRDVFFAVCVFGARSKYVTLVYEDFRPGMSEDARGLQAQESVASFRVK